MTGTQADLDTGSKRSFACAFDWPSSYRGRKAEVRTPKLIARAATTRQRRNDTPSIAGLRDALP
jgi:hypothetical protein